MSVTETIPSDQVADSETLYRSVWQQPAYIVKDDAGRLRLSSAAFDDAANEISLYRHGLCDAPPYNNPPRMRETDCVVSVLASLVRQQKIPFGNSGETLTVDVRPDTVGQHISHAVVYPDRSTGTKIFRRVRKRMAELAEENWSIPPTPEFVASLESKATE